MKRSILLLIYLTISICYSTKLIAVQKYFRCIDKPNTADVYAEIKGDKLEVYYRFQNDSKNWNYVEKASLQFKIKVIDDKGKERTKTTTVSFNQDWLVAPGEWVFYPAERKNLSSSFTWKSIVEVRSNGETISKLQGDKYTSNLPIVSLEYYRIGEFETYELYTRIYSSNTGAEVAYPTVYVSGGPNCNSCSLWKAEKVMVELIAKNKLETENKIKVKSSFAISLEGIMKDINLKIKKLNPMEIETQKASLCYISNNSIDRLKIGFKGASVEEDRAFKAGKGIKP